MDVSDRGAFHCRSSKRAMHQMDYCLHRFRDSAGLKRVPWSHHLSCRTCHSGILKQLPLSELHYSRNHSSVRGTVNTDARPKVARFQNLHQSLPLSWLCDPVPRVSDSSRSEPSKLYILYTAGSPHTDSDARTWPHTFVRSSPFLSFAD